MGVDGTRSTPTSRTTSFGRRAGEFDAERGEQPLDLARLQVEPAQTLHEARVEGERCVCLRRLSRHLDLAGGAAAKIAHERGRLFEPRNDEGGIDAALEAMTRVRLNVEPAPRARRALGIEIGRLDKNVGGGVRHAGVLAADDAAEAEHAFIVGDDAHIRIDVIALAVERAEGFALAPEPRTDRA
jgi:hypothetical protein